MFSTKGLIALCVDADGEINLVGEDGTIEVLFPTGSVVGCVLVQRPLDSYPLTTMYYFDAGGKGKAIRAADLKLDYLEGEE